MVEDRDNVDKCMVEDGDNVDKCMCVEVNVIAVEQSLASLKHKQ